MEPASLWSGLEVALAIEVVPYNFRHETVF